MTGAIFVYLGFFLCTSGADGARTRRASTATGKWIYIPASCYTQTSIVRADVPLASCALAEKPSAVFTEFSELQAFFSDRPSFLWPTPTWEAREPESFAEPVLHQC